MMAMSLFFVDCKAGSTDRLQLSADIASQLYVAIQDDIRPSFLYGEALFWGRLLFSENYETALKIVFESDSNSDHILFLNDKKISMGEIQSLTTEIKSSFIRVTGKRKTRGKGKNRSLRKKFYVLSIINP